MTLLSGIASSISSIIIEPWNIIPFIVFCVSLPFVFIQILGILLNVSDNTRMILNNMSCIVAPKDNSHLMSELNELLDTDINIKKLLIICYGTRGYAEIVPKIDKGYCANKKIDVEVMICCPNSNLLMAENDKVMINNIKNEIQSNRIKFYHSFYPPSVRACVVYNKSGCPIWCCTQIYSYQKNSTPSAEYEEFFSIVTRGSKDYEQLMTEMDKQINGEFNRLKKQSLLNGCFNECKGEECKHLQPKPEESKSKFRWKILNSFWSFLKRISNKNEFIK